MTSSNAEQDEVLNQQDTALEKHWESTSKLQTDVSFSFLFLISRLMCLSRCFNIQRSSKWVPHVTHIHLWNIWHLLNNRDTVERGSQGKLINQLNPTAGNMTLMVGFAIKDSLAWTLNLLEIQLVGSSISSANIGQIPDENMKVESSSIKSRREGNDMVPFVLF